MNVNLGRYHLLTNCNDELKIYINDDVINGTKITGGNDQILFYVMCKKPGQKLPHYLQQHLPRSCGRSGLMNAFFMSQFSYCHLVWMCHKRIKNTVINRLQKRC